MREIVILSMIAIIALPVGIAHAQSTYDILIPTGAAAPSAPYFWQVEKTGDTNGNLSVEVLDTVAWKNADTAAHTVTSGTAEEGPDGIFDSSLFPPGQTFEYQFTELGEYPYFCIVHPWMVGTITVETGLKTVSNVGANVGDGMTTFDVEYEYNRSITSATVNEEANSITFGLMGQSKSDDHTLVLKLPSNLISGISSVSVDGTMTEDYTISMDGDVSELTVASLEPTSETVTVTGASVVPEFGSVVGVILVLSIVAVIIMTSKSQKFGMPKL